MPILSGRNLRIHRKNMRKSTAYLFAAALVAAPLLVGSRSQAQSLTTFASIDTIGQVFTFVNAGAGSTFGLVQASIPVTFRYKVVNDYGGVNVDIPATMTLTANVTGGAGGFSQLMNNVSLNVTANSAVNGSTNLLSMGSTGRLSSTDGSDIANFGGNTRNGFTVGFSSDFLNFGNTTARSFNFAFNSLDPTASQNANGYMNTWTASGLGNFASNPAPLSVTPEPGTLGLLALTALPALAGLSLRRRRVTLQN
jgi:hypothetical protein